MIDRYLAHTWHIFPLRPRSKEPLTEHGWKDASTDPNQISEWQARWPNSNWGIATGPSNLLVVDLDGFEGQATWARLTKQHEAPTTLTSITGGGGRHVVYLDPHRRGRNTTKKLGVGIDTRGQGGYIVAPPSIHPNGQAYRWAIAPLRRVPEWVLRALQPPRPALPPPRIGPHLGATAYGERALAGILDRLRRSSEGERHDINYWAAVRAGQLYASGHIPMTALDDVRAVAAGTRTDQGRVDRDTREGWAWGTTNSGGYPTATHENTVPQIRVPRVSAPR